MLQDIRGGWRGLCCRCKELMAMDVPLPRMVPSKLGEGGMNIIVGGSEL